MKMHIAGWMAGMMALPVVACGAPVWEATFDTGPDGVVDLKDQNAGKVMIGGNVGGKQLIRVADNLTNAFEPDKAGRPLGTTIGGSDSFSARYVVAWSSLPQTVSQVVNFAGFLGDANPQTRQVMGSLFAFNKFEDNYYVQPIVVFGSTGTTNFGSLGGTSANLGPDAQGTDFQIAISFDATTRFITSSMLDMNGNVLTTIAGEVKVGGGGIFAPPFGSGTSELDGFVGTHLGWSDYSYNYSDASIEWYVDSMAFYNTADGALADAMAVPEPTSLAMIAGGALLLGRRRRD